MANELINNGGHGVETNTVGSPMIRNRLIANRGDGIRDNVGSNLIRENFVAVGAGGTIFTGQVCGSLFPDVPVQHPACDPVELLAARQVVSGFPDGTFRPDDPVTRAQLIKIVSALTGLKPGGSNPYKDVAEIDWSAGPVSATASGRLIGWGAPFPVWTGDTLQADTPVTRTEAAMVMANLAER